MAGTEQHCGHRGVALVGILCASLCFIFATTIFLSPAKGQGAPQPVPTDSSNRLKISYLADLPRGTKVTLLLMSGERVSGELLNVKTEHDVVCLQSQNVAGKTSLGNYKAVAIAGVEWTPNAKKK